MVHVLLSMVHSVYVCSFSYKRNRTHTHIQEGERDSDFN
jgi:hypothetical protein